MQLLAILRCDRSRWCRNKFYRDGDITPLDALAERGVQSCL
jgi:hypothetical protein